MATLQLQHQLELMLFVSLSAAPFNGELALALLKAIFCLLFSGLIYWIYNYTPKALRALSLAANLLANSGAGQGLRRT